MCSSRSFYVFHHEVRILLTSASSCFFPLMLIGVGVIIVLVDDADIDVDVVFVVVGGGGVVDSGLCQVFSEIPLYQDLETTNDIVEFVVSGNRLVLLTVALMLSFSELLGVTSPTSHSHCTIVRVIAMTIGTCFMHNVCLS